MSLPERFKGTASERYANRDRAPHPPKAQKHPLVTLD
jgi:hypothetical protein